MNKILQRNERKQTISCVKKLLYLGSEVCRTKQINIRMFCFTIEESAMKDIQFCFVKFL